MSQLIQSGGVQVVTQLNQIVYLDFDGEYTSYNGEILNVDGVVVEDSKLSAERIAEIVAALNEKYAPAGVKFVTERPIDGEYSTVYVGKTDDFDQYGNFAGLAETIDKGNLNKSDNAFVMLDSTSSDERIIATISHETDHLLGTLDHGGDGLEAYAYYFIGPGETVTGIELTYDTMYVASYAAAYNTSIDYDGCMYIHSSGYAGDTTVYSHGSMFVSNGGSEYCTTVNSGGVIYIESGGYANSTTVNAGGTMYISNDGFARNVTENGGYVYVENVTAATFNRNTISGLNLSCGSMTVHLNTVANSVTVGSGGHMHVYSGGVASNTTINSSGSMDIQSSGVASNTTINDSGYMFISSGGVANSTTVSRGGDMCIASGGTAMEIKENGGYVCVDDGANVTFASNVVYGFCVSGRMTVHSNTTMSSARIDEGWVEIYGGGIAKNTTLDRGNMIITSGGHAYNTTVNDGYVFISDGGRANSLTVNVGAGLHISSGGTATEIKANGGYIEIDNGANVTFASCTFTGQILSSAQMTVYSNTIANSTSIGQQGHMYIFNGGVANSTTVKGGDMYISNGGIANSTTVDGGDMHIFNGGVANSTTMDGGSMFIQDGGTASSTTVNGGVMHIFNGGVANSTTVDEGWMFIQGGGTATEITENGGYVNVADGANVTFTSNTISGLVLSYTSMTVHSNTTANNIIIDNGAMYIYSGGIADNVSVYENGKIYVYSGGTARIAFNPWGSQYVWSDSGAVISTLQASGIYYGDDTGLISRCYSTLYFDIESGKSMFLYSGGIGSSTRVYDGGHMHVCSGGVADGTYVIDGDMYISNGGVADGTDIHSYGYMYISNEGIANGTDLHSFGSMYISNGGIANNTTVDYNGGVSVMGKANYTSVYSRGFIGVYSGGSMFGVNLYSGAELDISSGGTVNALTFNGKGTAYVYSGGQLTSTTINSSGTLAVYNGAKVTSATLKNGGTMNYYGGTVYNADLLYGGVMNIQSGAVRKGQIADKGQIFVSNGGTASGAIIKNGGIQHVLSGGSADDTQIWLNGVVQVSSGAIVTDMLTKHGAKVHVFGGTISNTTMERGITSVYQGGKAVETEVGYGAYLMLGFTSDGCSGIASSYDTTVLSGGGLTVMAGAKAGKNTVYGTLTCNNGGRLLGETVIHGRANLAGNAVVTDETSITFDVSERSASAMQESYREAMLNSYYVAREADMTISVSADQAEGSYILANWALEAKKGTFTLEVDGTEVGTFSTTKSLTYNGKTYSLYCFDDATNSKALTLKVSNATARDAWTELGSGDFDGDGIEESLVSDGTNLYAASEDLWLGNLSATEEIASITDYNNDGTDDILIHNTATDQMTAWLVKDGTTYSTLAIA